MLRRTALTISMLVGFGLIVFSAMEARQFCWSKMRFVSDNELKAAALEITVKGWQRLDARVHEKLLAEANTDNCCQVYRSWPFQTMVFVPVSKFTRTMTDPPTVEDVHWYFNSCGCITGLQELPDDFRDQFTPPCTTLCGSCETATASIRSGSSCAES